MRISFSISNYQAIRDLLAKASNGETYRGVYSDVLQQLLSYGARVAREVTHWQTGTLAGAHTWEYDRSHQRGSIFVGNAINPITRLRASDYAMTEHARGGSHAFYSITYARLSAYAATAGVRMTISGLKKRLEGR